MGKKAAVVLLTTCLLLSACSTAKTSTATTDKPPVTTSATQQEKTTPDTQQSENKDNNDATSGSTDGNEPSKADATVEKTYHMNKVYNIVPNKEGTEKKVVFLTFDDGPKEADMINKIIDTLDKHHAKAVFFVNGYRVKEHPELLKLIHDRGQLIGNHSWDHIVLKNKPEAEVKKQIEDVQKIVKDTIGETPVFFRPPHGAGGDIGQKIAKENGLLYTTWSVGSLDWTMKQKDANKTQSLIKNVMDQLHPGSNILMHELPWTTEALDSLLTKLEEKGYSFVDPRSIETVVR